MIDDSNFNSVLSPLTEVTGCFSQLSFGHLLSILLDHVHPLFSNKKNVKTALLPPQSIP